MNEQNFVMQLKGMSDDMAVPDTLHPDNSGDFYTRAKKKRRSRYFKLTSAIAGCLVLIFSLSVVINTFAVPQIPVVLDNEPSSYEQIYKTIKALNYTPKRSIFSQGLSIYSAVGDAIGSAEDTVDMAEYASGAPTSDEFLIGGTDDYSETNTQVQGVDEGDIVKTDGAYVYVLGSNRDIRIVRVNNGQLQEASVIRTSEYQDGYSFQSSCEMYLVNNYLVLVSLEYKDNESARSYVISPARTRVQVYDIADRNNPFLLQSSAQDGEYVSSRLVNGYLYTITNKRIYNIGTKDEVESYVPVIDNTVISCDSIILPSEPTESKYTVVSSLAVGSGEGIADSIAFLGGSDNIYVSAENIYLPSYRYNQDGKDSTEIIRVAYKDGVISKEATGVVEGSLNDQFSMDEQDGYLRLVTTTSETQTQIDGLVAMRRLGEGYNNLFVLDGSLSVVGSITGLAEGERIYSARFLGDTAYFVTFRQVDPLFSVDLSDPENPQVMGELKIPGFSSYLHPYAENLLLGIGMEADETGWTIGLKISMFDTSDPYNVQEYDKYVFENFYESEALRNHKSVLVDAQKDIIGFSCYGYTEDADTLAYIIFGYDEENGFYERATIPLDENVYYNYLGGYRGMYIGDYLVIANSASITAYAIDNNFQEVSSLQFN